MQPGGLLLSGLMRADGLMQERGYGACQVASTFLASLLDTAQLQAEGVFDELCPSTMPHAMPPDRLALLPSCSFPIRGLPMIMSAFPASTDEGFPEGCVPCLHLYPLLPEA